MMQRRETESPSLFKALCAVLFVLLTTGSAVAFLRVFQPRQFFPPDEALRSYDSREMREAMAPQSMDAALAKIEAFGSRATGQPGNYECAKYIREAFSSAGLEILEQELDSVRPAMIQSRIGGADGRELDARIWPYVPAHVQPMVTPEGGLSGKLVLVDEELLKTAASFNDKIALVDTAVPLTKELGMNASRFADLGFKALIVASSEGFGKIPWTSMAALNMQMPVNYVRLAADEKIFKHVGQEVRLDVKTAFRDDPGMNLIGVMKGDAPAKRALVVMSQYDGYSALPDLNCGPLQALQVATQLQILKGLLPHRGRLMRDVIFIASCGEYMARNSLNELLGAAGRNGETWQRSLKLADEIGENGAREKEVKAVLSLFEDEAFGSEGAPTEEALGSLTPPVKKFFDEQFRYVLRLDVFSAAETLLQAQIAFERHPEDIGGDAFKRFRSAKTAYDRLNTSSSYPVGKYLDTCGDGPGVRRKLLKRFDQLLAHHQKLALRLEQELKLNRLFGSYEEIVMVSPLLNPAEAAKKQEVIGFTGGSYAAYGEAAESFQRVLQDAIHRIGAGDRIRVDYRGSGHGWAMAALLGGIPVQAEHWSELSYPAFSVISPENSYKDYYSPLPPETVHNLASIELSLQILGESVLGIAYGQGRFQPLPHRDTSGLSGSVYAAGVGNSAVPNFPVDHALVCGNPWEGSAQTGVFYLGQYQYPMYFTDPYGRYSRDLQLGQYPNSWNYTPQAAHYGTDGLIDYYKDEGAAAQNIYRSVGLRRSGDAPPVNLVLFRASPVAILNRINPQTLKEFTDATFIKVNGLTPFGSTCKFIVPDGILDFVGPKERFYVALKAGSAENELVATTRAFCLGVLGNEFKRRPESEIDGPGYLAADTPIFRNVAAEAAASMAMVNQRRIDLQKPYGMIDEMTSAFHEKSAQYLSEGRPEAAGAMSALRNARHALTYSILNHPVIRGSISEAIWGILWYMALLVPFVFFFEKLVFGFTDIRKQLVAQGIIFLAVFSLLRALHPAFEMIRSSFMILLGFVIILISGGITILLSGKFHENLEALNKLKGSVKGAQVNKMGIMITAFMLGLNNMHRRKVRTGLTCATLVLMTFVMICFTSVQSDIVSKAKAVSKAAYQGLLIKEQQFRPISGGEIAALNNLYSDTYTVNERYALVGMKKNWNTQEMQPPDLELIAGEGADSRSRTVKSALLWRVTEPLQPKIKLLTSKGWFTPDQARQTKGPYPIIIPDKVAEDLRIAPADVDKGEVKIQAGGQEFIVHGIFDSGSLERIQDLDGDNVLPFDVEALVAPKTIGGLSVIAENEDPRVQAAQTVLGLAEKFPVTCKGEFRVISVAVNMDGAPFKAAKGSIDNYLERSGRLTYYGLDGVAYLGQQSREKSMAGMVDLLIPLVIAALTVLNTMKGSVYERRDEIFVYNAVGIAPRYIFFMFIAEAMVYAVVGVMLGYICSQGAGRVLTSLGWTGGINMNFTSLSTVYASLTIVAATFLSTYFPARSAMEIAKPTEKAGWSLPKTETDELQLSLPFTFTHYDRIAVLGFFHKFFVNHGEGSSGPFFAGDPRLGVSPELDKLANGSYVPRIQVPVWLKPFDLGVSQRVTIELPTDPETGEFISRMTLTRLTGTRESWDRLNKAFVAHVRRHFLHWRAVSEDMKKDLYEEARIKLEHDITEDGANG